RREPAWVGQRPVVHVGLTPVPAAVEASSAIAVVVDVGEVHDTEVAHRLVRVDGETQRGGVACGGLVPGLSGVDDQQAPVLGVPGAVLDVLAAGGEDQRRPRAVDSEGADGDHSVPPSWMTRWARCWWAASRRVPNTVA